MEGIHKKVHVKLGVIRNYKNLGKKLNNAAIQTQLSPKISFLNFCKRDFGIFQYKMLFVTML